MKKEKKCIICKKKFNVSPSQFKRRKTCSKECQIKYLTKLNTGKHCHSKEWKQKLREKLFKDNPSKRPKVKEKIRKWNLGKKYSKLINKKKGLKGKLNPNWKGGKTKEWLKFRSHISSKLAKWSKEVKKRDNFTCQNCQCNEKEILQSHHIFPIKYYPELTLDLDNGITLCYYCHKEIHYG